MFGDRIVMKKNQYKKKKFIMQNKKRSWLSVSLISDITNKK
jgi:hypothetical protein